MVILIINDFVETLFQDIVSSLIIKVKIVSTIIIKVKIVSTIIIIL
jgi:hypothetical protein